MRLPTRLASSLLTVTLAVFAFHCSSGGTTTTGGGTSSGSSGSQTTSGSGSCTPDCSGASCGSDGCGGSCGTCSSGETCSSSKRCEADACKPSCSGRSCGPDGCGGKCGTCSSGETCSEDGACEAACHVVVWASSSNPYTDSTAIPNAPSDSNECDSKSDCCKGGECIVGMFNPLSQGYCVAACGKNSDCSTGCCDTAKGWCRAPHTGCGI